MKLNLNFNQWVNFGILVIVSGVLSGISISQCSTRRQMERNIVNIVQQKNEEIELSRKIAENAYGSTIDSLTVLLDIKPKQVVQWMRADVQYRDTGSVKYVTRPNDTIPVYPDSISARYVDICYTIDLLLYKGELHHTLDYNNTFIPVIIRERPHKLLFIKYGKWVYSGKLISDCNKEVYEVYENVNIIQR